MSQESNTEALSGKVRVLYVGIDACDAALMEELAASDRCPTFAGLLRDGAAVPTIAPYGTFVGSSWMTISTGSEVSRHQFWNWLEVDPITYEQRPTTPRSALGDPFWIQMSDAGQRIAVLDVPHMDVPESFNGMIVKEWGCHDRHHGTATYPPELLDELDRVVGRHPVGCRVHPQGADAFAPCDYTMRASMNRTLDEERQLADLIRAGVDAKHRASVHVLDQGPWDLFATVLGEAHCVGHQFWHLHDPSHPRFDAASQRVVGDLVEDVYERLDGVLGDLLSRVDNDVPVYVQLSHGMGPHFDGDHLLDELLLRIDQAMSDDLLLRTDQAMSDEFQPGRLSRLAARVITNAPTWTKGLLRKIAAVSARMLARRGMPTPANPTGPNADRRWYQLRGNTTVGAVRFNLKGRESQGKVAPGVEYEGICHKLEQALLEVIDIDTGKPLVRRIVRAEQVYERKHGDLLPDLFIEWNRSALVERVWSPLTGVVVANYSHWRTGDHNDRGLFIARGPGIQPGRRATPMALTDVAPTLAAAVGVHMHDIDGISHQDLLTTATGRPASDSIPQPPKLALMASTHRSHLPELPTIDGIAAAALDHAVLVDRRVSEQIAGLQSQLNELRNKIRVNERDLTVWSTMAWLALEPVLNDVLVSVITPTYQRPEKLADAIGSVRAQRHQRWEMLIVDDGSHTARDVVASFADPRLRVFDAEHGGACAARNVALDEVQGELVTYLDDDNLLDPGWLHAVVWAFRNHPSASVLYGARIIDDSIRVYGFGDGGWPWLHFNPYDRRTLEQGNFADMGVMAHRVNVSVRFDENFVESGDWDFFLALTANTTPLELPVVAMYYRTDGKDRLTGQSRGDEELIRKKWAAHLGAIK